MSHHPQYFRVLSTFLRNSAVREMTFRGNFLITVVTRAFWFAAQVTLFEIIFRNVDSINEWTRDQYFAFMATAMLINSIVEAFFMPNCANFSELIRTGNLDFALLKPIDTQFLISFEKIDLANLTQLFLAVALLVYALDRIGQPVEVRQVLMYLVLVGVSVVVLYSLMIALASTSIWFGRNQGLYDFWFYITSFARYPRSIYGGADSEQLEPGDVLQFTFSFVIPILLVVTVPARVLLSMVLDTGLLPALLCGSVAGLLVSRAIFNWSLRRYRSASS